MGIQIIGSVNAQSKPKPSDLKERELGVNVADRKLYTKNHLNEIIELGGAVTNTIVDGKNTLIDADYTSKSLTNIPNITSSVLDPILGLWYLSTIVITNITNDYYVLNTSNNNISPVYNGIIYTNSNYRKPFNVYNSNITSHNDTNLFWYTSSNGYNPTLVFNYSIPNVKVSMFSKNFLWARTDNRMVRFDRTNPILEELSVDTNVISNTDYIGMAFDGEKVLLCVNNDLLLYNESTNTYTDVTASKPAGMGSLIEMTQTTARNNKNKTLVYYKCSNDKIWTIDIDALTFVEEPLIKKAYDVVNNSSSINLFTIVNELPFIVNGSSIDTIDEITLLEKTNSVRIKQEFDIDPYELGTGAVDLGHKSRASHSFTLSTGTGTQTGSDNQFVLGKYNEGKSTTFLEVGDGVSGTPKNIFEIGKNGQAYLPNTAYTDIVDDKALITKEYYFNNTPVVDVQEAPNDGNQYARQNEDWAQIVIPEVTGLIKLSEDGTNSGWRLAGFDPLNYGDIGKEAVDLSISTLNSTLYGATGVYSLAYGNNTISSNVASLAGGVLTNASAESAVSLGNNTKATAWTAFATGLSNEANGEHSATFGKLNTVNSQSGFASGENNDLATAAINGVAFGYNNVVSTKNSATFGYGSKSSTTSENQFIIGTFNEATATDTIFEVGIGTGILGDPNLLSNALEIYKDGKIKAPRLISALIDSDYSLTTKKYVDDNISSNRGTGLALTSDDGDVTYGWRLTGKDALNYGVIGSEALDFSHSDTASTTFGATGVRSVAFGYQATAEGDNSFSFGKNSKTQDEGDIALGESVYVRDNYTFGIGKDITIRNGSIGIGNNLTTTSINNILVGYNITTSGTDSYAIGNNLSSNYGSFIVGRYGSTPNGTRFVVANGNSGADSTALEIYDTGVILAPSLDRVEITDTKCLVTKEYSDNSTSFINRDFDTTSTEDTFTVPYVVGKIQVFVEGIRLRDSAFVATNGTTVVLNTPVSAGTWVMITEYF